MMIFKLSNNLKIAAGTFLLAQQCEALAAAAAGGSSFLEFAARKEEESGAAAAPDGWVMSDVLEEDRGIPNAAINRRMSQIMDYHDAFNGDPRQIIRGLCANGKKKNSQNVKKIIRGFTRLNENKKNPQNRHDVSVGQGAVAVRQGAAAVDAEVARAAAVPLPASQQAGEKQPRFFPGWLYGASGGFGTDSGDEKERD